MNKIFNFFLSHLKHVIIFYIIIQIVVLFFLQRNFTSDSYNYYRLAEQSLKIGSIYPASINLYDDFIIAPLYVNLILFVLFIYNSIISIGILNIILNMLQLFLIYKITLTIFNETEAKLTVLIYVFYLNTLGMIILNLTELFFGVLILSSIILFINNNKKYALFAGILAGASVGVRPFGWVLLVSVIIYELYFWFKKKIFPGKSILFGFGFLLFVLTFGFISYINFHHFVFTSTMGGFNLIIGASNDANGAYNEDVFYKGNIGYINDIQNKTYIEKGDYWQKQAINWIMNNRIKWLKLMPLKILHLFILDDTAISNLLVMPDLNFAEFIKYIIKGRNLSTIFSGYSTIRIILYLLVQTWHLLFYYCLLFITFIGIREYFKTENINPHVFIILLFFVLGIIVTLIVFGSARYKYPYIISLLPFAAVALKSKKRIVIS